MIGLNVKRGVAATMERVTANAGVLFESLQVVWTGTGAGIRFERFNGRVDATVILPAIDDLKEVSSQIFHNLIAFALHEGLGHAVYTDNEPWDNAREKHGAFLGNLINGLEDPRIEQCAIRSGFAPNAKQLFENLLNSMLERDGYPEAGDIKNIPFILAVEGRRLNGYQGDQEEQQGGDQPSNQKSDQQGDQEGDQEGDQLGKGWSNEAGRDVEPTKFIDGELKDLALSSDAISPRPFAGKPQVATFDWV